MTEPMFRMSNDDRADYISKCGVKRLKEKEVKEVAEPVEEEVTPEGEVTTEGDVNHDGSADGNDEEKTTL